MTFPYLYFHRLKKTEKAQMNTVCYFSSIVLIQHKEQDGQKVKLKKETEKFFFCGLRPFSFFCVYRISIGSVVSGTLATGI